MGFNREMLPEPQGYFENTGLVLQGVGKWRSTACAFHGGTRSMRLNVQTGAFVCMSCGARGGDLVSYEMQVTGAEFVEACKSLGAWTDDGRTPAPANPAPFSARAALEVLSCEVELVAVAASNMVHGVQLTPADNDRILQAAGRILKISDLFKK
jgi:hypothetical protein